MELESIKAAVAKASTILSLLVSFMFRAKGHAVHSAQMRTERQEYSDDSLRAEVELKI